MKNKYLSRAEKEYGSKLFLKHCTFNGFGISFLGDTPVFLMAIYFGATNIQLGYISSVIHMSGIILVILPSLLSGINIIKVQYRAWLLRGLLCLLYGLLFFLSGQTAVVFILAIYTMFCVIRMFGMAVAEPIQQMLTTPSNVGEFVIAITNRFHISRLLSYFISFLILSIKVFAGLPGLLIAVFIGIINNTLAAYYLKKIPAREVVEYRKGNNIFRMFITAMKQKNTRIVLIAKWLSLSVLILIGFVVPFLSKVISLSYNYIFLFMLVSSLSTVIVGLLVKPFVDRIGSKSMVIISSFGVGLLGIIWAMLPETTPIFALFLLYFFNMFFLGMVLILLGRLFLISIPDDDRITFASMANFFSALVALFTGLCGGYLIDVGERLQSTIINPYGLVFLAVLVLSCCNGVVCCFLKEKGSLSVRETAQILFSTRNLRAYLDVYHFNQTNNPIRKKSILMHIADSDTELATSEIGRILKNPLSNEKGEAIKSLFLHPRQSLLPEVIREAQNPYSRHRIAATFTLGGYKGKEVERALIELFDDPDTKITSTAAKSLARIGNLSEYNRILELAKKTNLKVEERLDLFIAIFIMDAKGECLNRLFDEVILEKNATFTQSYLSLASQLLEMEPPLAEIYENENCQKNAGFSVILQEAKQVEAFNRDIKLINTYVHQEQYREILLWSQKILKNYQPDDKMRLLKEGIQKIKEDELSEDLTLAIFYFTFQMLA
jgi:hypothetical protein